MTGFAAERIDERLEALQERHGLRLETVFNPKALEWNNAYSLWCAREHFAAACCSPTATRSTRLGRGGAAGGQGRRDLVIALDQSKTLGEEEMKVHVTDDGLLDRINKALDPASAQGEYIGVTLIEPHAAEPLADALEATFERDPQLYYEDGFQELADRGGRVGDRADRRGRVGRGRRRPRPGPRPGGRLPLLTRMVGTPLAIDIGAGAVARPRAAAGRPADLQRRSRGDRRRARASARRSRRSLRPQLANAELWTVEGGSVEAATELAERLRDGFYDALVGIGGGRTLDVAKYAASLSGLPMVAVATTLAHDGLASPVASLEDARPQGLLRRADADRGDRRPRLRAPQRAGACAARGIGDVISNLSAIADWRLAERERGEAVDGVAVTFARTAATSIVHREDGIDDDEFLIALAEALVLSGLAMATAGSSAARAAAATTRSCTRSTTSSRAPASHGELAGAASLFTAFLRGEDGLARALDACLRRHGLPAHARRPRPDRGAVRRGRRARAADAAGPLHDARAPRRSTRPAWSACAPSPRLASPSMPSIAELRAATQPASIFARNSGEHWAGRLYMRRLSPYLTRLLIRTPLTPNAVTWLMILVGLAAAAAADAAGRARRRSASSLLIQLQLLLDCSDGELARWRSVLAGRDLPRPGRPLRHRGGAADRARRSARTAAGTRSAAGRRSAC